MDKNSSQEPNYLPGLYLFVGFVAAAVFIGLSLIG